MISSFLSIKYWTPIYLRTTATVKYHAWTFMLLYVNLEIRYLYLICEDISCKRQKLD